MQPTEKQLDNAIKAAVSFYAEAMSMSDTEVFQALHSGDESVKRSIMMLMEVTA